MTTNLSVAPGIDMSRALGSGSLTKKWLTEYLAAHPEKDFRIISGGQWEGKPVNGEDCLRYDLSLQMPMRGTVAVIDFAKVEKADLSTLTPEQRTQVRPQQVWGYRAIVR